jgi:hypothetical protein
LRWVLETVEARGRRQRALRERRARALERPEARAEFDRAMSVVERGRAADRVDWALAIAEVAMLGYQDGDPLPSAGDLQGLRDWLLERVDLDQLDDRLHLLEVNDERLRLVAEAIEQRFGEG